MTDEDIRAVLRGLRDEPVPADSLARVRLAVAEGTTSARRRGIVWKFAAALASAAVVILAILWLRPIQQTPSRVAEVREPVTMNPVPAAPVLKSERRKKTPNRRSPAVKGEPVIVRIETADPDVVILLIGD